ncbi:hypothetical protein TL16_g10872 [Triparma laevis f. inornata]|uniref:non-specific serine/threonine protein kinase n=1 Tax=Triparma laevis f. inornata TaxID=1714386 RepID=A0A9W7ERP2_9STRA|nr:hypothetical protein TL16_g10872 [Triparma laevis f. inornata]
MYLTRNVRYALQVAIKLLPTDASPANITKSQKYLKLERKINSVLFRPSSPTSPNLVKYWGCINKNQKTEGIVFDCVKSELTLSTTSRPLLQKNLQTSTWPRTLDKIFSQLLSCLLPLHDEGIVHRDVKPENVMVDVGGNLRIIDLGSAAVCFSQKKSFNPFKSSKIGLDDNKVAISPTFAAPETFVDLRSNPLGFDVFSIGFLFLCICFRMGHDERLMSSFRQQLESSEFNLTLWLSQQLKSTILSTGVVEGLEYMQESDGEMFKLLERMVKAEPVDRPSVEECIEEVERIKKRREYVGGVGEIDPLGSPFIRGLKRRDEILCSVPTDSTTQTTRSVMSHFNSDRPLGLVLEEEMGGVVRVTEIEERSQAGRMGRIKIGDELVRVGGQLIEGYDSAVEMIANSPSKIVSLEFLRDEAKTTAEVMEEIEQSESPVGGTLGLGKFRSSNILMGSHSSRGRRQYNEDTVIQRKRGDFVLGGVFDGHGGSTASAFCEAEFVKRYEETLEQFQQNDADPEKALSLTWKDIVQTYIETCADSGCAAEYDSIFGVVKGYLTTATIAAGTTATIGMFSNDKCHLLNCGDSRACLYESNGDLKDRTIDHRPDEVSEVEVRARSGEQSEPC